MARKKESIGKYFKRKLTCLKFNAMNVMNMGISKGIVLNSRRKTRRERREMKPMSLKK